MRFEKLQHPTTRAFELPGSYLQGYFHKRPVPIDSAEELESVVGPNSGTPTREPSNHGRLGISAERTGKLASHVSVPRPKGTVLRSGYWLVGGGSGRFGFCRESSKVRLGPIWSGSGPMGECGKGP